MYKNNFVKTYIITPPNYSIAKPARANYVPVMSKRYLLYILFEHNI